MKGKAAIYHFTDKSSKRPKIYQDQLATLKRYAASIGFNDADIFCDMSLRRCDRTEFDRFLSSAKQYDVLVTKDFYHISKNTGKCIEILKRLKEQGTQVYTLKNGMFSWEDPPFMEPLRVATYTCHYGSPSEIKEVVSVRNDVCRLFISLKTRWTLEGQYYDESFKQRNGEQIQMETLIKNRDMYDLLLVHTLNDVHWRTANFCRIWEQLQLDIYSLQEGFLRYRGES